MQKAYTGGSQPIITARIGQHLRYNIPALTAQIPKEKHLQRLLRQKVNKLIYEKNYFYTRTLGHNYSNFTVETKPFEFANKSSSGYKKIFWCHSSGTGIPGCNVC